MLRWLILLLLALLTLLQIRLWHGAGSWPAVRELERTVAGQRSENAALQRRNQALGAEVEDLKQGEAAAEERARSELGMIKPGEVFYRVVEPPARAGDAAAADDDAQ